MSKNLLLTGGAGFIGHKSLDEILKNTDWKIKVIDRLSYAGDLNRIKEVLDLYEKPTQQRVEFIYHDLKAPFNRDQINQLANINYILHIGASSHVTRSVQNPETFIQDNIVGTFNLLEFARVLKNLEIFYYFSTDEVFGPSYKADKFKEWDRYNSKNPYSASKAAGEELSVAYENTYGIPVIISHCCNVYGWRQHSEKYIPNTIKKILNKEKIIVHTDKNNVPGSRYYIHNDDLAKSILFILNNFEKISKEGIKSNNQPPKVNISGKNLVSNLEIAELISSSLDQEFHYELKSIDPSRPGHDIKYGLDNSFLNSLGGVYDRKFNEGLRDTVEWYLKNKDWIK
mgnify:CR=1 FL=1|tara:strand:+ start:1011 stop:2036 length:1026 start_codon:yes stop_codon:yes gene_type:complete